MNINSKFDEYYLKFLDIDKAVKINNIWYIRNRQKRCTFKQGILLFSYINKV